MKKFLVLMTTGIITISADSVTFEPGHVCFWRDENVKQANNSWKMGHFLVRAIHNPAVEEVKEITGEQ